MMFFKTSVEGWATLGLLACVHVSVCGLTHAIACLWRSENNLQEPGLSFHHVGPKDGSLLFRLGGRHPHLLKHLARHLCFSHAVSST